MSRYKELLSDAVNSVEPINIAKGNFLEKFNFNSLDDSVSLKASSSVFKSSIAASKSSALPDLCGTFDKIRLPETIGPDSMGEVKFSVTNQGNRSAVEPLKLNLFASTDTVLNPNDQFLSSLEGPKIRLAPGQSRTYTLTFTNPAGVALGAYYLLVSIDADAAIAESNEINNLSSARVSATGTDVVLDWNATLLNAVATDRTTPPRAAQNMAIVHSAIYGSVLAVDKLNVDRFNSGDSKAISLEAAVAAAAHRILVNLYPTQSATFNTQLTSSLAEIADGQAERNGIVLGGLVADLVLGWRSTDGASFQVDYTLRTDPGDWQPTPPNNLPALLPQWGEVTPFVIACGSQFRPEGPPALGSTQYAADFNQVKALGSLNSTTRTDEQTEIAHFWADGAGTFTPPGHWNQIAEQVSLAQENARLFALLNAAEADAAIVAWDAKYEYDFWRPITAIRQADIDGNADTIADLTWIPLLVTPPFPEYVSGHSTFSGAADAVLTNFFGNNIRFSSTSVGLPGVRRSFDNFTQAANEAGISRIYGGIHFQSANKDGLAAGRAVGNYISETLSIT